MLESSRIPRPRPAELDTSPKPGPQKGEAAHEATLRAEFDTRQPILLGTFGTDGDRRALLRLPDGKVAKVAKGDRLGREIVLAIDDGSMVLNRGGKARRLAIPGS